MQKTIQSIYQYPDFYEELTDLIEIFDGGILNIQEDAELTISLEDNLVSDEVMVFKVIRDIVDGKPMNLTRQRREALHKQLEDALEFFECIGVTIFYVDEYKKIIG